MTVPRRTVDQFGRVIADIDDAQLKYWLTLVLQLPHLDM